MPCGLLKLDMEMRIHFKDSVSEYDSLRGDCNIIRNLQ